MIIIQYAFILKVFLTNAKVYNRGVALCPSVSLSFPFFMPVP